MKGFMKESHYKRRSQGKKRVLKMKGKRYSLIILIITFDNTVMS